MITISPPPPRSRFIVRPHLLIVIALMLGLAVLVKTDNSHVSYSAIDNLRYADAIAASKVKVGVVFAQGDNELYYGMQLAFADPRVRINSSGKWVQVEVTPLSTGLDVNSVPQQVGIARRIARDPSYVAVIGHTTSSIASMASVSYEYTNLLYIATTATDPSLTNHGFAYVFRTIPTDEELSDETADLCQWLRIPASPTPQTPPTPSVPGGTGTVPEAPQEDRISKIGIFYEQIDHSEQVIKDLESAFTNKNIAVTFEKAYDPALNPDQNPWSLAERNREARLEDQIDDLEESPPQMIVVVGDTTPAAIALWRGLSRSPLRDVPLVVMAGPLDANAFMDNTDRPISAYPEILSVNNSSTAPATSPGQELQPGAIYVVTDFSTAEVNLPDNYLEQNAATAQIRNDVTNFTRLYQQRFGGNDTPANYRLPEALAMRGYVAGEILKQAMAESASVAPVDMRQTLRIDTFDALGRKYTFSLSGDEKGFATDSIPVIFKRFSRR